jgi:hypothetical protein
MGLVIFAAIGLYLLISIAVVCGMVRTARKNGRNAKLLGWSAALMMYLIPFWDWLPTVATHQYYCATEAGFWMYKTLDQWKQENPGVMETLVANKGWPSKREVHEDGHEKIETLLFNERVNVKIIKRDVSLLLPIMRREEELIDIGKNEVLAKYVDFATGNSIKKTIGPPGPIKFWLHSASCAGENSEMPISARKWMNQFRGVEK